MKAASCIIPLFAISIFIFIFILLLFHTAHVLHYCKKNPCTNIQSIRNQKPPKSNYYVFCIVSRKKKKKKARLPTTAGVQPLACLGVQPRQNVQQTFNESIGLLLDRPNCPTRAAAPVA
jgi:hypothetical protein